MTNSRSKEFNCYGITLILCTFVMFFLTMGISVSFGIIIRRLLQDLHRGIGETTWIASVNTGLMYGFSPVASLIEHKHGCRLLLVIGSCLVSLGMVLSFFVPSLHYLYLTYGVISGCGSSMVLFGATVPVLMHFNKNRNLANSFACLGTGFGIMLFPFIIAYLLEEFGWRGSFLLLGGTVLNISVCGMLLSKGHNRKETEGNGNLAKSSERQQPVDLYRNLMTNYLYIWYCVSGAIILASLMILYFILPDLVGKRGLSVDQQAMVITVTGIATTTERPFVGYFFDKARSYLLILMGIGSVLQSFSTVGLAFIQRHELFIVFAVILGITSGTHQLLQSSVLVLIVESSQFGFAVGTMRVFIGVGNIIGPPAAGWLTDYRGNYDWACYFVALWLFIGGISLIIINILTLRKKDPTYDTVQQEDVSIGITTSEE